MKNRIELTIEHKDHSTVELTNGKGDTFTYNPQKYEGLEDLLNGAKTLPIGFVSSSLTSKEAIDYEIYAKRKDKEENLKGWVFALLFGTAFVIGIIALISWIGS